MATIAKTDWKAREQGLAAGVADLADQVVQDVSDTARDAAQVLADRAKEAGAAAVKSAGQAASYVSKKAEAATSAVGSGIESLGDSLRQHGPRDGAMGTCTAEVAKSLESTGHYIKHQGLSGIGEDLTNLIRRHPVPALLAGIAAGYLIARATRR